MTERRCSTLWCSCLMWQERRNNRIRRWRLSKIIEWRVSNAVAERRWIRPVDLIKPFGPIKCEHDDKRLGVFAYFLAANCLLSAGKDSNCEVCLCNDKFIWIKYSLIWRSEMSMLRWESEHICNQPLYLGERTILFPGEDKVSRNCSARKIGRDI